MAITDIITDDKNFIFCIPVNQRLFYKGPNFIQDVPNTPIIIQILWDEIMNIIILTNM